MIRAFAQAFRQMRRNKAMTVASIFAITAMLFILGLFFSVMVNVESAAEAVKDDYNTIEVYLVDGTTKETIAADQEAVSAWDGVEAVHYRTRAEAMKIMKERWGKSGYLLDGLKDNPLPDSFVITVGSLEKADAIAAKARALKGREDVRYYKDTVGKLLRVTRFIRIASLIAIAVLLVIAVVVVANTIKLTVLNRAREIAVMKYIGATNWFIRGPFLVEGLCLGALSAAIASGVIALLYKRLQAHLNDQIQMILQIPMVDAHTLIINMIWIFMALGISVGIWGTILSMRRFLDT
ncbi:MAG: permease-like cell division protein FtsX [Eubacteriales bacterium]|jgi:cell division transport system permease protein|nr:permease-like cell division protein FtsX [Eubacteriales bacterium]